MLSELDVWASLVGFLIAEAMGEKGGGGTLSGCVSAGVGQTQGGICPFL